MQLPSLAHLPIVIGALIFIATALLACAVYDGVAKYRTAFIRTVAAGLQQNFVIADAGTWFLISLPLLGVSGGLAFWLIGPVGAIAAAIVAIGGPRAVVTMYARARSLGPFPPGAVASERDENVAASASDLAVISWAGGLRHSRGPPGPSPRAAPLNAANVEVR
jgi:hypothetical protein